LTPALAYVVSCVGSFLGLQCVSRGRARGGWRRATWLAVAAVSIGATGIWAMHFIAMLGFSIPTQQMLYSLPITVESLLLAILVVGAGLFIVGYGKAGWARLLPAGVLVGLGVAAMHYRGMDAMNMTMHYDTALVAASIAIAIVAGTAGLWAGLHIRGTRATIGAALIMGVAVSGMHYTGMYAMEVNGGTTASMSGSTAVVFVIPLLLGLTVVSSAVAFAVSAAPSEDDVAEDAKLQERIDEAIQSGKLTVAPMEPKARTSGAHDWAGQLGAQRPPRQSRATDAFGSPGAFRSATPDGYSQSRRRKTV
jgi:NO-binding membrane sensor protein with MHYT domain